MGTNATAFVEVREPDNSWRLLPMDDYLERLVSDAFHIRTKHFYARLGAGPLVLCEETPPLAELRGWPSDTSNEARETYEGQDAFGTSSFNGSCFHTWFTLKELLDDELSMSIRGEELNKLSLLASSPDDMRVLLCWD